MFTPTPSRQPLTDEETTHAVRDLVRTYPVTVKREIDPPVPNQGLAIVTFEYFDVPKQTKCGKPLYGFGKVRMCVPGSDLDYAFAQKKAEEIVREIDSKHKNYIAPVGHWFPLTTDDGASREAVDVRMTDEEVQFRDQAAKEKLQKDRQIARELQERSEELRHETEEGKDIHSRPESLEWYTMHRVTEFTLYDMIKVQENKVKELRDKLTETRQKLLNAQTLHPEYVDMWVDRYNAERKKSGISAYIPNEYNLADYNDWIGGLSRPHDERPGGSQ